MTERAHTPTYERLTLSALQNLFRAEWHKVAGNRWVVIGLIWIFPIAVLGMLAITALILTLDTSFRVQFAAEDFRWTDMAIGVWNVPNNPFLRIVLLGFVATVFAGEYQWGTWKNTLPRNRRTALILTKLITVGAYVLLVFVLTSIVLTLGWGVLMLIAGVPYGPALSGDVLRDFVRDYGAQASASFTTTIISAGYAALAAMITRSILGSLLVSFILTVAEMTSGAAFALLAWVFGAPRLFEGYRFVPAYNVLNVLEWINNGKSSTMTLYEGEPEQVVLSASLEFSLLMLAVWVIGLVTLTVYLFRRQDITT